MRYDRKCPVECRYALKDEGLQVKKTNADSITEFKDLISKLMDLWIKLPQKDLDDQIPEALAKSEKGKNDIINYFNKTGITNIFNIIYIKDKLNLSDLRLKKEKQTYEDIAREYLNLLLSGEYHKALNYRIYGEKVNSEFEWQQEFIKMQEKDLVIKKMNEFRLIASALSEDRQQAIVYYDINGKYDLSILIKLKEGKWLVSSRVNGKLEVVNGEKEALEQIAVLISKGETSQGEELLTKYINIYPESSDLYYYKGILAAMKGKNKLAKICFFRAVWLDPEFKEAIYNYALQLHLQEEREKAMKYYRMVLEIDKKDLKTLNNIAALLIDDKKLEEAVSILNKCDKIDAEFEPVKKNWERLKKASYEL